MAIDNFARLIDVIQQKSNNANEEDRRRAGNENAAVQRRAGNESVESQHRSETSVYDAKRRAGNANEEAMRGKSSNPETLSKAEQQSAVTELKSRLRAFRQSLSPAAAAQLDQLLEWASQHR